ncbi:Chaperone SurA [bacterium HR12]|nr:Chaperone SurA [bacterium HR12]
MTRRLIPIALASSIVVILVALAYGLRLGPFRPNGGSTDPGPVIARVDGRPIHLAEAAARVESLCSVHGDVREVLGEAWPDTVLQSLVDDRILEREAERLGIRVTPGDIQAHLENVRSMLPEGQDLDAWLAAQGVTLDELQRRIRLQILGARVFAAVTEDVRVTSEEIRAYYRDHRAEFEEADGTIPPLLEVRRSIRDALLEGARNRAYAAWLRQARRDTEVVILMPDWWERL